jgi:hypothetical protein
MDLQTLPPDAVERAYDLACSGGFDSVGEIVKRLKVEGYRTVLTDLRSRSFRRELRTICIERGPARARPPHAHRLFDAPDGGSLAPLGAA